MTGPALTHTVPTEHPGGTVTYKPGCRLLHVFQLDDGITDIDEGLGDFNPGCHVKATVRTSRFDISFVWTNASSDPIVAKLRDATHRSFADVFLFGFAPDTEGKEAAAATKLLQEVTFPFLPIVPLRVGARKPNENGLYGVPMTPEGVAFRQKLVSANNEFRPSGEPCIFDWDFRHCDSTPSAAEFREENALCAVHTWHEAAPRSAWHETLAACEEAYLCAKKTRAEYRRRRRTWRPCETCEKCAIM